MKHKLSVLAGAAVLLLATGCSQDLIEENNTPEGMGGITFRATTGRSDIGSRADNISTTDDLESFKVWAYGTRHDGTFCEFIRGTMANKSETGSGEAAVFKTATTYLWPTDIVHMDFYAAGASNRTSNEDDAEYENGVYSWVAPTSSENAKIKIDGFHVRHNPELTWNEANNEEVDKQEDVIVALTHRDKAVNNTVSLTFNHAMSNINLRVENCYKSKEHDGTQVIKIKGAWIVTPDVYWNFRFTGTKCNEIASATTQCTWFAESDPTDPTKDHYVAKEVTDDSKVAAFGQFFNNTIEVRPGTSSIRDLLTEKDEDKYRGTVEGNNLIMPSQQLPGWPAVAGGNTSKDALTNGTYILLLARLELEHSTAQHSDQSENKANHQIFPYTGHYAPQEYSYICVPISGIWEPGKQYTYTLKMLGNYGFGQYPPSNHPMPIKATHDGNSIKATDVNLSQPIVVVYRDMNKVSTTGTHPTCEVVIVNGKEEERETIKTFGSPVLENEVDFEATVTSWGTNTNQDAKAAK